MPPGSHLCHLLPSLSPQAGITTTLNSRCSVLAAANSVFGRWDETKGEDNIDFMPTILSRFDMIFIVKDEHNEERDVVRLKTARAPGRTGPGPARAAVLGEGHRGLAQSPDHQFDLPVSGQPRRGGCGLQRTLDWGSSPASCVC